MLEIITEPNEILRKRSEEIDRAFLLKKSTQKLIEDMVETMYQDDGIGLAAPQVEKNIRICVIGKEATVSGYTDNPNLQMNKNDLVLINPTWEKTSRRKTTDVEGCLSVPKTYGKVKRWKNIKVEAMDKNGNLLSFDAVGFLARVIQHEVDHLDGILFIDKAKGIYTTD